MFKQIGLGSGGAKGLLIIGALLELSKHQPLEFPDGIYGSSIGSLIATFIAFGFDLTKHLPLIIKQFENFSMFERPTISEITSVFYRKGIYSMDTVEKKIVDFFKELDIDIKTKKISDAKMPLRIIASNITKGIPTIFSGDVMILDAIKCSCCVPGVFKPQELYGQVYIDGGWLVPCLSILIPNALVLSLPAVRNNIITPKNISQIETMSFLRDLYSMAINRFAKLEKGEYALELNYKNLFSNADITKFDLNDIFEHGGKLLRDFLISKGFIQELSEVGNSGLS